MYVNDTDGIGNIELEAESDISYTSLGGQPLMSNFIAAQGGWYYSPLNRWIMAGPGIPMSKLRVVDPCWAQGLCAASGTTTPAPPPPTSTPPAPNPPTTTPPAPTPPTTTPPASTPPASTPAPPAATPVASAPVSSRPAPVKSTSAKHAPKKPVKAGRRTNLAHTASVRAPSCGDARSRTVKKRAKRATCATAGSAGKRRPARRG
jgi:hypothetical protein